VRQRRAYVLPDPYLWYFIRIPPWINISFATFLDIYLKYSPEEYSCICVACRIAKHIHTGDYMASTMHIIAVGISSVNGGPPDISICPQNIHAPYILSVQIPETGRSVI
jgi:hypothetical protein